MLAMFSESTILSCILLGGRQTRSEAVGDMFVSYGSTDCSSRGDMTYHFEGAF